MDPGERIEHLWNVIGRIDGYIRSTNTKAAVVATFNTFVLGALGSILQGIATHDEGLRAWEGCSLLWLLVPTLLSASSLLAAAWAVFPYLRDESGEKGYKSRIFFKQIADYKSSSYVERVLETNVDDVQKDLARQIHSLSLGANRKFISLQVSFFLLVLAGISLLALYPFYVR